MTALTRRFTDAVDYARIAHAAQRRKETEIPYLSHLLAVASIVLDHGGSEDQAIAALLHDVVEDQGSLHIQAIRAEFGEVVSELVTACSDDTSDEKTGIVDEGARYRNWLKRKREYVEMLERKPASHPALLVSASDKLHNALSIVLDVTEARDSSSVWGRFKGGTDGTLAYYESITRVFETKAVAANSEEALKLSRLLRAAVERLRELASVTERRTLADLTA